MVWDSHETRFLSMGFSWTFRRSLGHGRCERCIWKRNGLYGADPFWCPGGVVGWNMVKPWFFFLSFIDETLATRGSEVCFSMSKSDDPELKTIFLGYVSTLFGRGKQGLCPCSWKELKSTLKCCRWLLGPSNISFSECVGIQMYFR